MKSHHGRCLTLFVLALFLCFTVFSWTSTPVHAYPAPKFHPSTKVCSCLGAKGWLGMIFFARISGPSPVDVASISVTGPAETFQLTLQARPYKQYGNYYAFSQEGIANGTYTFHVTDTQGRSATLVREFAYDSGLPQIDPNTMSPSHKTYTGTTTPTLSFTAVQGDYYYQILILDYGNNGSDPKAVWYYTPIGKGVSITVPSGVLQPNTAYQWKARVWDSPEKAQNYNETATSYFYTGTKGNPEIDAGGVISLPWDGNLLNFFWARAINVAPWDIDHFTGTGPDSTIFDLKPRVDYGFQMSAFNAKALFLDPPNQSIPDGTYTVEIKDVLDRIDTNSTTYVYNPVPDFLTESRIPANNTYFDTNTPTFSWARVTGDTGDGSYRYSIRIMSDYPSEIRWYDSPLSPDISFTLPAELNLPRGNSYKWRLNVYGPAVAGGTDRNNCRCTDLRTFTINGPARFVNINDAACGGKSPCYTSIQGAIDAAETGDDIFIAQGTYPENITLEQDKDLRLLGGWNISFETQNGTTTFRQAPKAPQGSLTLQELTIKPQ